MRDWPRRCGETGNCKTHHVVGTIRYPEKPKSGESDGKILYIKSFLTGMITREEKYKKELLPCETTDILNYRFEHATFPHDTTANQWFTESQFESYRCLGQHIVKEVERNWDDFK